MRKDIFSIQKGSGENTVLLQINDGQGFNEIREEKKDIGSGKITVYRGYMGTHGLDYSDRNLVFEVFAGSDIIVRYK